jgi:DHA2 family multidrug resistance protein-like MFS transporter
VFALSIAVCAASFAAQMLALVVLPFHLTAAGYSAVEIGLLIIPWPLTTALAAPISGSLSDRYPAGLLGFFGLMMFAAGLAALALLSERANPVSIALPMALAGAGFGLYQSPNNRTIQGSAPRARSGAASGMASMARLLGQTIGAALAAFLFSRLAGDAAFAALWLAAGFAALGAIVSAARLTDLPQPKGKGA